MRSQVEEIDPNIERHVGRVLRLPLAMRLLQKYPEILDGTVPDLGSENLDDVRKATKLVDMRNEVGADRFAKLVKGVLGENT